MLTEAQKSDIRRFMGYPMFGDLPNQMFGCRFMTHYGVMEYRMIHLSASEEAVVIQMIADCATLETAIMSVSSNLDTDRAAVWFHNKEEFTDRKQMYRWKRSELCKFFGVPNGPGMGTPGEIIV
jgi:hypothetical protein